MSAAHGPHHRFEALDGLRGVAALGVILLHFGERSVPWIAPHASLAVDFFFMLSGFVITCAYEQRLRTGLSVSAFMTQRLIRLYPLIVAGTLIGALGYFKVYQGDVMAAVLISALLLMPTPFSPPDHGQMAIAINPPAWSLTFELAINLVYAMFVPILTNRVLFWLIAGFAVMLVGTGWVSDGLQVGARWPTILGGVPRVGFAFFAGIGLYRVWRSGVLRRVTMPLVVPVIILIAVFAPPIGIAFNWLYDVVAVMIIFPLLVVWGANAVPARSQRACRIAGELSYPAYILQGGFVPHVSALPAHLHLAGASAAAFLLCAVAGYLTLCWLVLRIYDLPMRAWLNSRRLAARPA